MNIPSSLLWPAIVAALLIAAPAAIAAGYPERPVRIIVPVSAGGSSTEVNVGAAHRSCNSRKRDR